MTSFVGPTSDVDFAVCQHRRCSQTGQRLVCIQLLHGSHFLATLSSVVARHVARHVGRAVGRSDHSRLPIIRHVSCRSAQVRADSCRRSLNANRFWHFCFLMTFDSRGCASARRWESHQSGTLVVFLSACHLEEKTKVSGGKSSCLFVPLWCTVSGVRGGGRA